MEFLTTKGIAASIEEIIKKATDFLFIISPYVKIDKSYIERLHEAERNKVRIYLIFGKEDMHGLEKQKFQDFRTMQILFLENLHAKCYINEKTALITSMNLHGYSEENNREMGIEIQKAENNTLYGDILKEAESIKNSAEKYTLPQQTSYFSESHKSNNYYNNNRFSLGHCIRCGGAIPIDRSHPLCINCYQEWAQYGNEDYPENFCHKCGCEIDFDNPITYEHPFCYDCWKSL